MFRTKKDVDKHVRSMLSKLREDEKNLRGYRISSLYFNIGEYESALEYIKRYIAANDKNAAAYKVLGQCYEKLKRPDKQLDAYQRSLELDKKQTDLLVEVCKLLQTNELSDVTPAKARYWYELAESRNIYDPSVLNLKLKFMSPADSSGVQEIILKEIARRPLNVGLRIRLVFYYLDQKRFDDAFKYVYDLEMNSTPKFRNSSEWYQTVGQVLDKYYELHKASIHKNWPYWLMLVTALERRLFLTLSHTPKDRNAIDHNILEATNLLFELDQSLNKAATSCSFPESERELASEFLAHFRGQLCLHSASLLFKRESEQSVRDTWHETTKTSLPLLLLAFNCGAVNKNQQWMKTASEKTKQLIDSWHSQGTFRLSQAGRTLQSCISSQSSSENTVLANLRKICMDKYSMGPNQEDLLNEIRSTVADTDWRKKTYRNLFTSKEHLNATIDSHFLRSKALETPTFDWPSTAALTTLEEDAQFAEPASLAHMVYLAIGKNNNFKEATVNIDPDTRCILFNKLSLSTSNLSNCSAETLNQLDITTFLYAVTIQAKRNITVENTMLANVSTPSVASHKPKMLPFTNMANGLCTDEQSEWWNAAYKVYNNASGEDLAELRVTLQHGIEAVRGVGNPKMDLIILLKLGQLFAKRVQHSTNSIERALFEDRSEALFKFALYMLRIQNSRSSIEPYRRLFKYSVGNSYFEIETEVNSLAEEAITFIAGKYFKNNSYEECIEDLAGIKLPFATYFQAESYRKMTEFANTPKKNKRAFLDKAREYFRQTLELLDGPNIDRNHPLKSIVDEDIKRLQNETRKLETNQTMTDSFVSANGRSDFDDTDERVDRDLENATPVPTTNNDNVERLVRQVLESISALKDDINDVRIRVQNIEEQLNKESDDVPSIDGDDDYMDHFNTNPRPNANDSSLVVNMSRNATMNYASPHSNRQANANQQQQQQQQNRLPMLPQSPMLGMNNSFNPMYGNYYGQMPFSPYQAQQLASNLASSAPYNDVLNYNLQQQLIAQQLATDPRNAAFMGLLPPAQLPPTSQVPLTQAPISHALEVSAPLTIPSVTTSIQQTSVPQNATTTMTPPQKPWNVAFNNAPVEKTPPVNIVITTSDKVPSTFTASTATAPISFSVTIPPQHIKNNPASMFGVAKANPTITAALQMDKKASIAESIVKTTPTTTTLPSTQEQKSIFSGLTMSKTSFSSTPFSSPSTPSVTKPAEKSTAPSPFAGFSFASPAAPSNSPFSNLGAVKEQPQTATSLQKPEDNAANTSKEDEADNYEPTAHFEPVIPLPDLVEVKTGEENETILFEHRAKLLRYVKESKEWKERGIGNIKVMANKDDPNKVRLLMRREQVLKLCCNQLISKDTKFNKMPKADNALSWFGQDYSDSELQVEMLAIRFKTAEICKQFHTAILEAQAKMSDEATESNLNKGLALNAPVTPAQNSNVEKKGFGDQFKPKAGSWTCEGCYISNKASDAVCVACASPKDKNAPVENQGTVTAPKSTFSFGSFASVVKPNDKIVAPVISTSSVATGPATGFGDKFKPKPGSWSCKACYTSNTADNLYCLACEEPKDDTVPKKGSQNSLGSSAVPAVSVAPKFSFGNLGAATPANPAVTTSAAPFGSSTFSFSFGSASAPAPTPTQVTENPTIPSLGDPKQFGFVFKPPTKSPAKPQLNVTNDGVEDVSDDENVEEEENNTYFTPVIPLPDKIDVKTGEEDEEVLYSHRAKLFRFREKEWRERGLGDVKILRHRQNGGLRVVMRRDQIHKICLNHKLTNEIEYKVKDPKSWQFVVNDFSEGELEPDNFCIRFKNEEIAKEFRKAIEDALAGTSKPLQNGDSNKTESNTENLTEEERKNIVDLQLPNNFYNYKDHEQCAGCRGCNSEDFVFSEVKDTNFGQFDDNPLPLVMPVKSEKNDLSKSASQSTQANSFSFTSALTGASGTATGVSTTPSSSIFGGNSFKTITPFGEAKTTAPATTFSFGQSANLFSGATTVAPLSSNAQPSSADVTEKTPSMFGSSITPKFTSSTIFGGNTNGTDQKPNTGISGFSFNLPASTTISLATDSPISTNSTFTTTSTPVLDATTPVSKPETEQKNTPIFGAASSFSFADLAKPSLATNANTMTADPLKSSSANSFSLTSLAKATEQTKSENLFSSPGGMSFADLAKTSSNSFASNNSQPAGGFFGLTNRDTFNNLMPTNGSAKKDESADDNGNAVEDANYDPHYEPIIELPDEIHVSTGEEEEEKIFGERAKLYRFDPTNKEWKERGVGEFKILHHPTNKSYRLLLRREQIHKLVLNMALSPDVQINPMKQSDKAFCWVAQNYAEDQQNGELESLSIRFKNADLATKFNQTVQNCIGQLKSRDLEPEDD